MCRYLSTLSLSLSLFLLITTHMLYVSLFLLPGSYHHLFCDSCRYNWSHNNCSPLLDGHFISRVHTSFLLRSFLVHSPSLHRLPTRLGLPSIPVSQQSMPYSNNWGFAQPDCTVGSRFNQPRLCCFTSSQAIFTAIYAVKEYYIKIHF